MVIVYIAGAISALTVIGVLVYLYRESAALPSAPKATPVPEPESAPESESAQPVEPNRTAEAETVDQEPAGGESENPE